MATKRGGPHARSRRRFLQDHAGHGTFSGWSGDANGRCGFKQELFRPEGIRIGVSKEQSAARRSCSSLE